MGLHQQWPEAEIIGVDIKEQPLYPFEMVVANAMDYPLSGFDFIWTSPPCQGYTLMRNLGKTAGHGAPKLIEDIRARLHLTSAPWVIENVVGAPLITPLRLCGSSFGLRVQRHRLFECNFHTSALPCNHRGERPVPVWGDGRHSRQEVRKEVRERAIAVYGDHPQQPGPRGPNRARTLKEGQEAMGIDWMDWKTLTQAIPPAYSRYIAGQFDLTHPRESPPK